MLYNYCLMHYPWMDNLALTVELVIDELLSQCINQGLITEGSNFFFYSVLLGGGLLMITNNKTSRLRKEICYLADIRKAF